MNTYISEGYPYKLTTREIKRDIDGFADAIVKHRANVKYVNQYAPLIQLGQIELQERKIKRTNLYTFLISVLSLFVSCSALFVSYRSVDSSTQWEQTQIELLKELKSELTKNNRVLLKTNAIVPSGCSNIKSEAHTESLAEDGQ